MSYFFLFLAAFDPQVPFLPNGIGFSFLISLVFLPFLVFRLKFSREVDTHYFFKKGIPFFCLFIIILFMVLIRLLANGGENIDFSLSWAKAFFVYISCFSVFLLFFNDRDSCSFVLSLIFIYSLNAVFNYVIGTYIDFFSFLDIFRSAVISDSLGENPYRNSFISGSGYFSIGTAYGLIVLLFSLYLVQSESKSIFLTISIVFTAAAGFVAARTAFFAIAPALFYILKSRFLYFLFLAFSGVFVLYFLLDLPALQPYKMWMLSFFSAREDGSGSYLIEKMYFWPGEPIFFFGMGAVNDGTFTYTDGGYMQDILFGGIFFLAAKLSFLAVLVYRFFRQYPLFVTFVSVAVLAFHFKGAFLYNNAQGMAAFYFIYFYLCKLDYEKTSNKAVK